MTEDERLSALCENVLYLQVQPKWCFGKGKCPGKQPPRATKRPLSQPPALHFLQLSVGRLCFLPLVAVENGTLQVHEVRFTGPSILFLSAVRDQRDISSTQLCTRIHFFLTLTLKRSFCHSEVKIIPTFIPEEQRASELDPEEADKAEVTGTVIGIAAVSLIGVIVVLDFPSLLA